MLNNNELALLTRSLNQIGSITKSLKVINVINDYNLKEDLETVTNSMRLCLLDNGIDPFQH
jgi:hypothetical protein